MTSAKGDDVLNQGFNEDELKDIISEIDELEAQFNESKSSDAGNEDGKSADVNEPELGLSLSEDELSEGLGIDPEQNSTPEQLSLDKAKNNAIQDFVEDTMDEIIEDNEPAVATVEPHATVVDLEKQSPKKPTKMDFHVSGDMEMDFCFYLGDQKLNLQLNANKGLTLKLDGGVSASIPMEGDDGFIIELDGGAKFTLPLSSLKKAS